MPRQPRLELPGIPRHVIQRGVNRCAIFLDDDNRHRYRRLLRDACRGQAVAIHAFVELNPVRAAMVATADADRWSSVHTHLGTACDPLLHLHPAYLSPGADRGARARAWRRWLDEGIAEDDLAALRRHLQQERALGDQRFQRMVARALNLPAACRPAGRPRKRVD